MNNFIKKHSSLFKNVFTGILFLIASSFMYGFYKSLSGFVANGFSDFFRNGTVILAYITPVFSFLFYFYNYYIKKIPNLVKWIYSCTVFVINVVVFIGLIAYFDVFYSNNLLGVYQAIPSIGIQLPFDMLIAHIVLFIVQIFNIVSLIIPKGKHSDLIEKNYQFRHFKIKLVEYIGISILAILTFVFVGTFIASFLALENILYDQTYIFLMLWILIIPLMNLIALLFKFEKLFNRIFHKILYLSAIILINLCFFVTLLVIEKFNPDFVTNVGQPLFPITFSVSLPIEALFLIGIQGISSVVLLVKIIKTLKAK